MGMSGKAIRRIIFVLGLFTSSFGWAMPSVAVAQSPDSAPDLPAMLLRTWDIADAGFDDTWYPYGGQCGSADQRADYYSERTGAKSSTLARKLKHAGMVNDCSQAYGLLEDPDDPDSELTMYIVSSVILFEDDDGATDAFDLLTDEDRNDNAEDIPEGEEYSRHSEATHLNLTDDVGPYVESELTFRLDNLIATVTIDTFTGDDPEYDDLASLADMLQDNIDAVLDGDGPNLFPRVIGVESDDVLPMPTVEYYVFGSQAEQFQGETPETFEERIDAYADATYYFSFVQNIPAETPGASLEVTLGFQILQFDTRREARDWLDHYAENREADPNSFDVVVRDDAPEFGDESIGITYGYTRDSGTRLYDRIVGRIDNMVFDIAYAGSMLPGFGIAERIAGPQVACLESGDCDEPLTIPQIYGEDEPAGTVHHRIDLLDRSKID
jgi:hypothetical protein